jgi:SWI/SNF-related matrix-associated actin-dependent regulator 1 of chromatin subfamily A
MKSVIRNDDLLEIYFPYDANLVDVVKALPDRAFTDRGAKHWTVPATPWHAALVKRVLEPHGFGVADEVDVLCHFHDTKPVVHCPRGLRKYQRVGVEFIEKTDGHAIIGDDPGTGKTVTTIGWLRHREKDLTNQSLIVAPTNVTYKWQGDLERWLHKPSQVVDTVKADIGDDPFIVMSYTMMRLRADELLARQFSLVVLDECHKVKSYKALQTKAAMALSKKARFIVELSGTPFPNRHTELFEPLHIADPVSFPNWFRYMERYTQGKAYGWSGLVNREELKDRLSYILLRRTKKDVLPELPEIERAVLPFRLDLENLKLYQEAEKELISARNILPAMAKLRRIVGEAKRAISDEWVLEFLQGCDEKLVIYTHHLDNVQHYLGTCKDYGASAIYGAVSQKERAERWGAFQNRRHPRVMVIDSAATEGIDLYAASNIWFAEREMVPMIEEQAEGRLHRMGQKNAVTAWYPMAVGTMDQYLDIIIRRKREEFKKVLPTDNVEEYIAREVLEAIKRGGVE